MKFMQSWRYFQNVKIEKYKKQFDNKMLWVAVLFFLLALFTYIIYS